MSHTSPLLVDAPTGRPGNASEFVRDVALAFPSRALWQGFALPSVALNALLLQTQLRRTRCLLILRRRQSLVMGLGSATGCGACQSFVGGARP